MPLWLDDHTGLTVRDIANRALGAIEECSARQTALGLIVVDYLQKVAVPENDRRKGRYEQVGDVAKGLKQLARDTGMPVVALAQLRRLGKGETPRRPVMDDLRESGDIEQEADVVVRPTVATLSTRHVLNSTHSGLLRVGDDARRRWNAALDKLAALVAG